MQHQTIFLEVFMSKVDIAKIDKKFDITENVCEQNLTYYDIPNDNFSLHGVFRDEKEGFIRLPQSVADSVSAGVAHLNHDTSGGRLCFSTNSKTFEICVTYDYLFPMRHMPVLSSSGFVLCERQGKYHRLHKILPPSFKDELGFTTKINLKGDKLRNYVLYFPLYGRVRTLSIGLDAGAIVKPFKAYKNITPILYYGSSITQGGCASRSDNSYQAFIEKKNHVDFINLGFSGNGKGEKEMIDYLASINCSLFVSDYNNGVITLDELRERHPLLYKTFRTTHPTTPILFLTKTNTFAPDENDHAEREKIIRSTYEFALKNGDKNVYFLSGLDMFKKSDLQMVTVDGDHPTDLGFYIMANKIYNKIKKISPIFK